MGYFRAFDPVLHFDDINGRPLTGGKLYTYEAGTSTPATTYLTADGEEANENPILLNARGECVCFLEASKKYKLVLKDSTDNVVWSADDVSVQPDDSVHSGDIYPMKVYTEGEHVVKAEYDPTDSDTQNVVQRVLTIRVNGNIECQYTPFDEEGKEVDIPSESVVWDVATHSLKKVVGIDESTIVEVNQIYQANSEIPISGKGVASGKFVSVKEQSWTDVEKAQARENINAIEGGDFLPRGDVVWGKVLQISLFDSILSVSDARRTQSGYIAPVAQDTDRGKTAFVTQGERGNELVYRFILENCDTNAKVIAAVQNGQIPYHTGSAGRYLPYIIASNGDMYLYNIFGVSDNNPMTGDALGLSLRKKVYNGNVIDECFWGKPYGINNFQLVEYSANDDYGFNIASKKMVWRRIPFDRELTITKFAIVANRDNHNVVQPTYMVGIFDFDGANVINVSESSTWTYGNMEGFSDTESVACIDDMQSYYGFGDYYIIEFTLPQPLVLQRGGNYLFPCYCNDAVKNGSPTIIAYKSASPALPWEELWTNTAESGNPVPSTAKSGCKASALRLTLSDGTKIWI